MMHAGATSPLLASAAQVLGHVESLEPDAVGVLQFGDAGGIVVESGRVCWAVARRMTRRLTDLLRDEQAQPLDRSRLEGTLERCRRSGQPIGEALVASGMVSESGLRTALLQQAVEAVSVIASDRPASPAFLPREGSVYRARHTFLSTEIFAELGARRDHALALRARTELETVLLPSVTGVAFVDAPDPIAVAHAGRFRVGDLREACAWASACLAVACVSTLDAAFVSGTWNERGQGQHTGSLVGWRTGGMQFVALTQDRAAAAVLKGRVLVRLRA